MVTDTKEVRVKLNIRKPNSTDVKNLWMCLNYVQKPTVAHIIEHIQTNLLNLKQNEQEQKGKELLKLYLDDFWLPPYENSRLLRENDCIKVDLVHMEEKPKAEVEKKASKEILTHKNDLQTSLNKNNNCAHQNFDLNSVSFYEQLKNKALQQPGSNDLNHNYENYYNNYYGAQNNKSIDVNYATTKYHNPEFYPDYYSAYNSYKENELKKTLKPNDEKCEKKQTETKKVNTSSVNEKPSKPLEQSSKKADEKTKSKAANSSKSQQQQPTVSCYKKFSIGNYAHLLWNDETSQQQTKDVESDGASGEQLIEKYYSSLKNKSGNNKQNSPSKDSSNNKKGNKKKNGQETNVTSDVVEKIAAGINSSGKSKWKNSSKPETTQPKHIRFTSSTDSGSDSTSSESSDNEVETKPVKIQSHEEVSDEKGSEKNGKSNKKHNKYYEPSKEDQLNAVSNNRSFFIQTTKDLNEFKKVFNQTKLNAPKDFEQQQQQYEEKQTKQNGEMKKKSPKKKEKECPPSPKKIDYNKYKSLDAEPRVNDKIAFQTLEISESFTPEISEYKTGLVEEFDSATKEVTIKLFSKYNSVLEKPSKFSIVFDEESGAELKENEEENKAEDLEDVQKFDWRNLMNVKLLNEASN